MKNEQILDMFYSYLNWHIIISNNYENASNLFPFEHDQSRLDLSTAMTTRLNKVSWKPYAVPDMVSKVLSHFIQRGSLRTPQWSSILHVPPAPIQRPLTSLHKR